MSIFKECTLYNSKEKIILNLEKAQSIVRASYKDANAVVAFPNSATDPDEYYVVETYEELREAILAAKEQA
jgi:hypothetical protein